MKTAQLDFPAPQPVPLADALRWQASPDWIYEEKKDGVRAMLVAGELRGRARSYDLPGAIPPALAGCTLDGELVGNVFWSFDLIEANGQDLRGLPLRERRRHLAALVPHFPAWLKLIPSWPGNGGEYLEAVLRDGGEGVVAKNLGAEYGRDWFKAKRVQTFDVICTDTTGGTLSVAIAQFRDGALVPCGRVSIFNLNALLSLKSGDVLEIAAECRHASGKFRSPRFVRVRSDKLAKDCQIQKEPSK